MNIDLKNIKLIKKIGEGAWASVYLVIYNNKKYALKILLENDKIKKNSAIWNELSLFKYIDTLKKSDQTFFYKLFYYQVYNNCNEDKYEKDKDKKNTCIKYLLEYKGETTLASYIKNKILSLVEFYSIILQHCYIQLLLLNGGYSQNDSNLGNIMINKTNKKYFKLLNKKIFFNGLQISIIDYNNVLHKNLNLKDNKYLIPNTVHYFLTNINQYIYNHIYIFITEILKMPYISDKIKYTQLIKKIINLYPIFFNKFKNNYYDIFIKYEKIFDILKNNYKNEILSDIITNNINKKDKKEFLQLIYRLTDQFIILFPNKFKKYTGLKYNKYMCDLSSIDTYNLLKINNIEDLIKFCILKLESIK